MDINVPETTKASRPDYKIVAYLFSVVTGWIVLPILAARFLGVYLDARFGTKPWLFLGLTFVAFVVSMFGIIRHISKRFGKK